MGLNEMIAAALDLIPSDLQARDTVTFEQQDDNGDYQPVTGLIAITGRLMSVGKGDTDESHAWAVSQGASHVLLLSAYKSTVSTDMRVKHGSDYYTILSQGVRHPAKLRTAVALSGTEGTT